MWKKRFETFLGVDQHILDSFSRSCSFHFQRKLISHPTDWTTDAFSFFNQLVLMSFSNGSCLTDFCQIIAEAHYYWWSQGKHKAITDELRAHVGWKLMLVCLCSVSVLTLDSGLCVCCWCHVMTWCSVSPKVSIWLEHLKWFRGWQMPWVWQQRAAELYTLYSTKTSSLTLCQPVRGRNRRVRDHWDAPHFWRY